MEEYSNLFTQATKSLCDQCDEGLVHPRHILFGFLVANFIWLEWPLGLCKVPTVE